MGSMCEAWAIMSSTVETLNYFQWNILQFYYANSMETQHEVKVETEQIKVFNIKTVISTNL